MARFDDFEQLERRVIREALTGAQSEFYDPGHTKEDRDTLEALIREVEDKDLPFTFGEEPKGYRYIDPATVAMPDILRENDGFLLSEAEIAGKKAREAAEKAQEPPRNARQTTTARREAYTAHPAIAPVQRARRARHGGEGRNRLFTYQVRPLRRRPCVLCQAAYHGIPLRKVRRPHPADGHVPSACHVRVRGPVQLPHEPHRKADGRQLLQMRVPRGRGMVGAPRQV